MTVLRGLTLGATALLLAACGMTATASPDPNSSVSPTPTTTSAAVPPELLGKVWTVMPTHRKQVALTFDCGGNANGLPKILATLAARKVSRATFFVTGNWARAFPTQAAQLSQLGYLVGNHTDHHLNLPDLTNQRVHDEIRLGRTTVRDATGVDPKPWLRFPYGAYDARILRITKATGWITIGWTVDTLGWQGTSGGQSTASVVQRVMAGLTRGEIVLMHVGSNPKDGSTLDADALGRVIHQIRAAGYWFATPTVMLTSTTGAGS